tara:strand:+ start:969 stop:1490 length:522 start_codon:yes stop_codon:yes gene_type:complete
MKITKRQLIKIIKESILNEGEPSKVGTAEADLKTAKHAASHIADPSKKGPAFMIYPKFDNNHSGYEFHITDKGKVGGGIHGVLVDSEKGLEIEGGVHIELPGLSGEKGSHAGFEAEISKAILDGNLNLFAKGSAGAHLGLDHGKVHISHPEVSGKIGVHGTFGKKGKHHKTRH